MCGPKLEAYSDRGDFLRYADLQGTTITQIKKQMRELRGGGGEV